MVLEQIYKSGLIRNKPCILFFLSIVYTIIGLGISVMFFPNNPTLVSVTLTTIMLLPLFSKLSHYIEVEEDKPIKHSHLPKILGSFSAAYLYTFAGIFLTNIAFAIMLPNMAVDKLFEAQLNVLRGYATFSAPLFTTIMSNNLIILGAIIFLSIIAGNGAILLIAWNASLWGSAFGVISEHASIAMGQNLLIILGIVLLCVLPHLLIEIFGYILGTMGSMLMSETTLREKWWSKNFKRAMLVNLVILVIAVLVIVIGALVETTVLVNIEPYAVIRAAAQL